MRIELTTSPWQEEILPLNYIHIIGGEYENRTRLSGVTSQYSNR